MNIIEAVNRLKANAPGSIAITRSGTRVTVFTTPHGYLKATFDGKTKLGRMLLDIDDILAEDWMTVNHDEVKG